MNKHQSLLSVEHPLQYLRACDPVTDPGGGSRGSEVPIRPDACLRQDRKSLFSWLIFLIKRALHFATKLNSKNIKKCNCFWVPSYDLFVSATSANGDRC